MNPEPTQQAYEFRLDMEALVSKAATWVERIAECGLRDGIPLGPWQTCLAGNAGVAALIDTNHCF